MKKLLLAFTLVLAGAFAAAAQTASSAQIKFAETTFNFGNITHNVPATHEFTFTNTGTASLIILDAVAGCGCTKPEFPKEAILAGKTGKIKVTFNAATLGTFSKVVTVTSNAGNAVTLTITGTVVEKAATPAPVAPAAPATPTPGKN